MPPVIRATVLILTPVGEKTCHDGCLTEIFVGPAAISGEGSSGGRPANGRGYRGGLVCNAAIQRKNVVSAAVFEGRCPLVLRKSPVAVVTRV